MEPKKGTLKSRSQIRVALQQDLDCIFLAAVVSKHDCLQNGSQSFKGRWRSTRGRDPAVLWQWIFTGKQVLV
jgi:hypothetical protein